MVIERWRDWRVGVAVGCASTVLITALLVPFESNLALLNEGLVFLLLTLGISTVWGVRAGVAAAILTNLALNFFFIPPLHQFIVHGEENIVALVAFLVVSVIGGSLVSATRAAADEARRRHEESEALLGLTRALIGQTEPGAALAALCERVVLTLKAGGAAVLSGGGRNWAVLAHAGSEASGRPADAAEASVADRVLVSGRAEGVGYSGLGKSPRPRIVLPSAQALKTVTSTSVTFIPLRLGSRSVGVLRLDGPFGDTHFRSEPERLLDAFAQEAALGLQRLELAQAAGHAQAWKQADEMKSALMASISHDLKTPLAAIKASASSLRDDGVNWSKDDEQAFLETIEFQADYLNRVITQMLELNRIQSGAIKGDIRRTYVLDLLQEACEAAATVTVGREVVLPAGCRCMVLADRVLIRQALVNLLENAAKYSPAQSPIVVTTRELGDEIQLGVINEGGGIPVSDLPYVFDSYYRGAGHRDQTAGSGLGLAIVKAFAEASGGRVWAESSEGKTRFLLALPRCVEPASVRR